MAKTFDELTRLFGNASGLPQPSKSPLRLSAMLEAGDPNPFEVEKLVHSDPALTAGLLKTSSAAAFGRQRPVTTVREAIMVLGFRSIRSIAIALWTQALVCEGKHNSKLELERFSKSSFFTGYLASELWACSTRPKSADRWTPEEVFALGVLSRLGVGLLSMLAADEFDACFESAKASGTDIQSAFQQKHGKSLVHLSAIAGQAMGLPEGLVTALKTLATGEGSESVCEACAYVDLATRVAYATSMGVGRWDIPFDPTTVEIEGLDLSTFDLDNAVLRAKNATTGPMLKSA